MGSETAYYRVLIPTYNDWESLCLLLPLLSERVQSGKVPPLSAVIVDDGSTVPAGRAFLNTVKALSFPVEVIRLRRNLGHQRAICIGLAHIHSITPGSNVVIMDADGEDLPEELERMIQRFISIQCGKIIFAERTQRSENFRFRSFYVFYRALFRLLTGIQLKMGHFSVLPAHALESLVVVSDLWNHFPSSILKSKLPYELLPTRRGERLMGTSKMNFVNLVMHGLSGLSVFADIISTRLLVASMALVALSSIGVAAVVYIRVFTPLAIPGWATFTSLSLLILLFQVIAFSCAVALLVLFNRNLQTFIPIRDYSFFVGSVKPAHQMDLA